MPSPTKSTPTMRDPKHASSDSSSISHVPLFRAQSHQPSLDELKLSHILNGETCPPISFSDFAAFVAHQEFTTENLLVIWYRSYRERYEQMSAEIKTAVPVPSTRLVDRYTPFAYLDKAMKEGLPERGPTSADGEVGFSVPADQSRPQQKTSFAQRQHGIKPCDWTIDGKAYSCGNANHHHPTVVKRPSRFSLRSKEPAVPEPKPILQHSSLHPTLPPAGTVFIDPSQQPMREEVQRAFATFLKKGGSRELGMSDELREFARTCLLRSTAPESFFPIYEEVYQVIESQSLPHFLTFAKSNINRPKQIFWYIVGAIDFFIGVVLFLILTLLLSPHNYGFRAIRLPSAIFIFFGTAQYYSATRGFCNQVWGRSSNQVKPWRLDDLDDEEADIGGTTGAGGLQTYSMASDNIITPLPSKDVDITLPNEVHPLADLSGTVNQRSSPLPWETASLPVLEGEPTISDTALRQLALRRATVKIPDASLAFPIAESPAQMHYTTFPKTSTFAMDSIKLSEISPVDTDPDFETKSDLAEPSSQTTKQSQPSISQDLSTLLVRFGRFAPLGIEPTTREKKKIQVFGPENLVEDPRIKRLYQSIVRDILIIAAAASAVWVVLCFAVPMRGLG